MNTHQNPSASLDMLRVAAVHGDTSNFDQDDAKTIARLLAEKDAEIARLRALTVKLAAFVDREHEYAGSHCHPQPPEDCAEWCSACQMLRLVTDDVLAEARAENRRLGYERT